MASRVPPNFNGGDQKNYRESWKQKTIRNDTKQQSTDERPDYRPRCHNEQEHLVASENGKTLVATVAGETDEHGGQANSQREASRKLDIRTKQQDERRDQQLAAGHTEQRSHYADNKSRNDPSDKLSGSG